MAAACRSFLLFRDVGDDGFGGEEQARDRRSVLQGSARDLSGIDDAGLDQVLVDIRSGVVAEVGILRVVDLADDDRTFFASVRDDGAKRLFDGATDDVRTNLLVAFKGLDELVNSRYAANQCYAAARDDAFFDSRAGCVHRIFDASLLFLHLGFGSSTDLDDRNAADELGEALLELLAIVVRGGFVDLSANFLDAAFDLGILTTTVDDGRVVLVDGDALGGAEVFDLHALELDAEVFRDGLAAGEDSDVLEHGFAAIAEAGEP